jgi:hypothetical protein
VEVGATVKGAEAGTAIARAETAATSTTVEGATASRAAPSLEAQAAQIKTELNGGRNSVTIKTPGGQTRYDLQGRAHGGVPTPHSQSYANNVVNGRVMSVTRISKNATPMNQQDIRIARKYLERK